MGAFDPVKFDTAPVGTVIQSPINLETLTNGKYIALDGRDCNRTEFSELAPYYPIGVPTATTRTLGAAPAGSFAANDGTYFLASDISAVDVKFQYSSTGATATWNTITPTPWVGAGSGYCINGIYVGSRWFLCGSAANAKPIVSTGSPNSNANWAITSGTSLAGTSAGYPIAYSPSLDKVVYIVSGSGANSSAIFYMTASGSGTAWSNAVGSTTTDRRVVVWTGARFVIFGNGTGLYQYSTDAANWTDAYLPLPSVTVYGGASDGAGTIVLQARINQTSGGTRWGLIVSKDHGNTWRSIFPSTELSILEIDSGITGAVSFANGRFFVSGVVNYQYTFVSTDGISWTTEFHAVRGQAYVGAGLFPGLVTYKGGVYFSSNAGAGGTSQLTFTEDTSKFKLHRVMPTYQSGIGEQSGQSYMTSYIKARS